MRRSVVIVGLSVSALLLFARASGSPGQLPLKIGDTLPPLAGQALIGKSLNLPGDTGDPSVMIFSFSRAGGRDAQNWAQRILKDNPQETIHTVIFLESVPRLFRAMAVSGIRSGMPLAMQDRTILMYGDEALWKQRFQITDEGRAFVMLLGAGGHIRWLGSGPFAETPYLELRKHIRTLN